MHLIAYISDYSLSAEQDIAVVTESIVRVAKKENASRGITGILMVLNNNFLQIIEGEEANLRQLMKNIEADPRHTNIKYLVDNKIAHRGFHDWNMDSFQLNAGQVFKREVIDKLTENFKKNFLLSSHMLSFYYKTLLSQPIK